MRVGICIPAVEHAQVLPFVAQLAHARRDHSNRSKQGLVQVVEPRPIILHAGGVDFTVPCPRPQAPLAGCGSAHQRLEVCSIVTPAAFAFLRPHLLRLLLSRYCTCHVFGVSLPPTLQCLSRRVVTIVHCVVVMGGRPLVGLLLQPSHPASTAAILVAQRRAVSGITTAQVSCHAGLETDSGQPLAASGHGTLPYPCVERTLRVDISAVVRTCLPRHVSSQTFER